MNTSVQRLVLGLLCLAVVFWGAPTEVCGADSSTGTWKLNLAKSKYNPGRAPMSSMVKYEPHGNGVKRSGESVNAEGKKSSWGYTANYDGKDYPATGSESYDTVALKRIDDSTVEFTTKKRGKVVATGKRVISKDGKALTITTTGTNEKGEKFNNVLVYDKQ